MLGVEINVRFVPIAEVRLLLRHARSVATTDIRDDALSSPHGLFEAAGSWELLLRSDALNHHRDRPTDRVAHRRMLLRVGQEIVQFLVRAICLHVHLDADLLIAG